MKGISKEAQAQITRILSDKRLFKPNVLRIKDKSGNLVPFRPNRPQLLLQQRSEGRRFIFVIKGRKMGISTDIIADDIYACATKKNQHAICLTQTGDDAVKMLEERIKPMIRDAAMPLGGIERGDHIFFPETNSKYYVGTAGAKKFGRGSDITSYHFSEFAHWPNMDVVPGIEEGLTDNAIGRIETTANGFNFAQALWTESKLGKTRYTPIFLPWYVDEGYRIPGSTIDIMGEEERRLVEAYGLTHDQIAWRREKIRTMSKPELFVQEYPSNDIEAFISSGRPVFEWISLQRHEVACSVPRWTGDLRDDGRVTSLIPDTRGLLKIWNMPEDGHVYVIGADVAEGLEDGAYSVAEVIDAGTDEQVAEWHGHIAPDLFAEVLINLGRYYRGAIVAPEAWPGPGAVTESHLTQRGYRNLYRDPIKDQGWETNKATKQKMILDLAAATRDLKVSLKSNALIHEMRSYMYNPKGGMDPATGSYSDRIMAFAIAWQVTLGIRERINYESPRVNDVVRSGSWMGGVTVPQWRGPVMGVRRD